MYSNTLFAFVYVLFNESLLPKIQTFVPHNGWMDRWMDGCVCSLLIAPLLMFISVHLHRHEIILFAANKQQQSDTICMFHLSSNGCQRKKIYQIQTLAPSLVLCDGNGKYLCFVTPMGISHILYSVGYFERAACTSASIRYTASSIRFDNFVWCLCVCSERLTFDRGSN